MTDKQRSIVDYIRLNSGCSDIDMFNVFHVGHKQVVAAMRASGYRYTIEEGNRYRVESRKRRKQ